MARAPHARAHSAALAPRLRLGTRVRRRAARARALAAAPTLALSTRLPLGRPRRRPARRRARRRRGRPAELPPPRRAPAGERCASEPLRRRARGGTPGRGRRRRPRAPRRGAPSGRAALPRQRRRAVRRPAWQEAGAPQAAPRPAPLRRRAPRGGALRRWRSSRPRRRRRRRGTCRAATAAPPCPPTSARARRSRRRPAAVSGRAAARPASAPRASGAPALRPLAERMRQRTSGSLPGWRRKGQSAVMRRRPRCQGQYPTAALRRCRRASGSASGRVDTPGRALSTWYEPSLMLQACMHLALSHTRAYVRWAPGCSAAAHVHHPHVVHACRHGDSVAGACRVRRAARRRPAPTRARLRAGELRGPRVAPGQAERGLRLLPRARALPVRRPRAHSCGRGRPETLVARGNKVSLLLQTLCSGKVCRYCRRRAALRRGLQGGTACTRFLDRRSPSDCRLFCGALARPRTPQPDMKWHAQGGLA